MTSSEEDDEISNTILVAAVLLPLIVFYFMYFLHACAWFIVQQPERNRGAIRTLALRLALALTLEPGPSNPGLHPSAIAALPLFVCCVRESRRGQGHEKELALECPICLGLFDDGDKARILPKCNHSFHVECIDKWLGLKATCPVCRACVMPMLQLEPCEPPVQSGPLNMVTITTMVRPGRSASEGPSELPSSAGTSSNKFRRMLGWERSSSRTQSGRRREDSTEHDIESQ